MAPKPRGKGKVALAAMLAEKREQQQEFADPMSSLGRPPTRAEVEEMEAQQGGAAPAAAAAAAAPQQSQPKKVVAPQPQPKKAQQVGAGFIPPGACATSRACKNAFERQFERHFVLPPRLRQVPSPLIEAVNDFHYAMMNDLPRNEFYYQLLKKHIEPGVTGVLEIGAGSGLLSMMAASLGAKWVVAVEGSADMARLAQMNVDANNMGDRVRVLNKMSFDLTLKDLPARPDVLVSEIFGTLMLGESALEYLEDVRLRKILKPEAAILPRFGKQYAVLVECPVLEKICSVDTWKGLSLSHMNRLVDTASCVFTKKYGFRMSDVQYKRLTEPIELVHVDFNKTRVEDLPMEYALQAKVVASGTAHAALYYWVAYQDDAEFHALMKVAASGEETEEAAAARNVALMSTDPADTRNNFPRDMQWGQALQLLDAAEADMPTHVKLVAAAEGAPASTVAITCRTSEDRVTLQLEVMPSTS